MSDKVGKVSVLLQTLSRIPGLGFLSGVDNQMRETIDNAEDYVDDAEEIRRTAEETQANARDLMRSDDDD